MNPSTTRIAVRSRRQAMDWSLVLASQGIPTTIERSPDDGRWELVVPARDAERAFNSLRQYRVENRGWPWRQKLPRTKTAFDWTCLVWAGLVILFYWLSSVRPVFKTAGMMDAVAVASGEWWRIFTAMMLHADVAHVATNLSIGIVLLGLAMGRFGTGTGLFAAYLAGAVGNLVSMFLHGETFRGLGSSGMVMGALGLLSAQTLRWGEYRGRPLKHLLIGVAAGIMLFALYGVAPDSDIFAHAGGFVAGLLLGTMLLFVPDRVSQRSGVNLGSGILLPGMIALTWWLALNR